MSNPQTRAAGDELLRLFVCEVPDIEQWLKAMEAGGRRHPDQPLLDLCGETLNLAKAASAACDKGDVVPHWSQPDRPDWEERHKARMADHRRIMAEIRKLLFQARKMKATTAAGIFAKAMLVRCSPRDAGDMAMSLAIDLVECDVLRVALMPGGRVLS